MATRIAFNIEGEYPADTSVSGYVQFITEIVGIAHPDNLICIANKHKKV